MTPSGRKDVKSHKVGRATLNDGVVTTAYHAIIEHECAECGTAIVPGALFSRRSRRVPAGALSVTQTTEPVCLLCRPLVLDDAGAL